MSLSLKVSVLFHTGIQLKACPAFFFFFFFLGLDYKIAPRAVHRSGRVSFWTQPGPDPPCVEWEAKGPKTDRRRHSVESVLGSGGVRVG